MRPDIYLIYLGLRLLRLPLRVLQGIGAGFGRLLLWRGGRAAHDLAVNLRIARPALDEAAHAALLREVMAESGKWMQRRWSRCGRRRRARAGAGVRGARRAATRSAGGRQGRADRRAAPGLLELLNYWLCRKTPMAILYRPPRIAAIEGLLRKVRGALAPEQVRADGAGVGGAANAWPRAARWASCGQKPRAGEGRFAVRSRRADHGVAAATGRAHRCRRAVRLGRTPGGRRGLSHPSARSAAGHRRCRCAGGVRGAQPRRAGLRRAGVCAVPVAVQALVGGRPGQSL
ncbi:lipid A biosynthesis acyltransferase [Rhodanobacter lindaniclasticus]